MRWRSSAACTRARPPARPIALLIRNTDQRSKDYGNILQTFRPGHADYTYWQKFGIRDPRGGGRSSARLTAPTVAAGAVAKKWLKEKYGTTFHACMTQVGDVADWLRELGPRAQQPVLCPGGRCVGAGDLHERTAQERRLVRRAPARGREEHAGRPGSAAVRQAGRRHRLRHDGSERGQGWWRSAPASPAWPTSGSTHGDSLTPSGFVGNKAGGVLGGISTGQDLDVSVAIKPTSSILIPRDSIDVAGAPPRSSPRAATTPAWASAPRPSWKRCWRWW